MNLSRSLSLGLSAVALAVSLHAEDIKINVPGSAPAATPAVAAPVAAQPAPASFTDAQILEAIGWMAGKSSSLEIFKLSPTEVASVIKGVTAAISGKESPYDLEKIGPMVGTFAKAREDAYLSEVKAESVRASNAHFAQLKANKAVTTLPSGLAYEIIQPGTGEYPKATDTVKVHYTGKLLDGSVFDSSVERKEPAEFPLNGVISGWTEGIQKINKGGKIRLHIPAALAYGDEGRPGIPPGATLVFDVELLDFKTTPAATPAK